MKRNAVLWLLWIAVTLFAGGSLASVLLLGGDRSWFLIGATTSAHHQIELACETCHTSGFFEDAKKMGKQMNNACLSCHEDELKVSKDSHPIKKFRDPRNADRLEKLNATLCVTCHAEHVPEITNVGALTLPTDYCSACHQDVGTDRTTHAGLTFDTCASAGCHNYHDNTALYEDFLAKHAGMPEIAAEPKLQFSSLRFAPMSMAEDGSSPVDALAEFLSVRDAVAPSEHFATDAVTAWSRSGHAEAGVNCGGCHVPDSKPEDGPDILAAHWIEKPGLAVCATCHKEQAKTFREGKHGMWLHPELAKPRQAPRNAPGAVATLLFRDEPVSPLPLNDARLVMKPNPPHSEIGNCNTCHDPHRVDLAVAAAEACATCHDDSHTRAYFGSPHHKLWQAELAGEGEPGTGVSCATCHMPKLEATNKFGFVTTHNQSSYLRPNEKMIRPVCVSCHGVSFAIDALADPALVANNFNGRPTAHVEGIDWAAKRARKAQ